MGAASPATRSGRKSAGLTTSIGLLLALGVPLLPIGSWGQQLLGPLAGEECAWWLLGAACLAYVLGVERRRLRSIGFRAPRLREIPIALAAAVVMIAGITAITVVVVPALHLSFNSAAMGRILATPLLYRVLLVTRAAVVEETLFRGYAIERLEEWSGRRWLAGGVSWAAFTLAHAPSWGWAQLLAAGSAGLLLTLLYLWRRNLWVNMLAHWLTDAAGFLLGH
ncbi:MAG TPA: CPBP family intramembrane glutamic endopeptidase [Terriglobales bacterium]|nr:CPBP family intramembrane glutamic endopeptidase [Terriglobales bacterium]